MTDFIFKHPIYEKEDFKILTHYLEQQIEHAKRKYPNISRDKLKKIIIKIIKSKLKDPSIQRVTFPSPGNHKKEIVPTSKHLKDINHQITAPNGNTYCQPKERESFIRLTIIDNIKQRGLFKKKMGASKEKGDSHLASIYDNLQKSKKISNNSTPGAMQSAYNIISDKSGFNTITSTTRLGVKVGYGTVERLLAGNIYLPTYEDALSYIYNAISVMPSNCEEILNKHNGISKINEKDFYNWLLENMKWYSYRSTYDEKIKTVISKLTDIEMSYIFYAGSLYNLIDYNKNYFRNFMDELFDRNLPIDESINPEEIYSLEETLGIMVKGTNSELFGYKEDGKRNTLHEAVTNNPNGIRKIIRYARHIECYMEKHKDLLSLFLKTGNETPQPHNNHNMIRKSTIASDTDSCLFTTNGIVQLIHGLPVGKTSFCKKSYDINAFSVYVLSLSLKHTFARYSSRAGIVGKDCYAISMKNEFFYPTFMRTNISKHYSGEITIQEGIILPKPQLDMKGVGYIGSTRPKIITDGIKKFMRNLFEDLVKTDANISAEKLLRHVSDTERAILDSLNKGSKEYLGGVNIKQPESYKDGGVRSTFYYRLWEEVFADHFRINVVLPNRFMKIPLSGKDKLWSNAKLMEEFKDTYPEVYNRMMLFRKNNPEKKINYLVAPSSMGSIPEMFYKWVDKRHVITDMCSPYYLAMKSLGLSLALPEKDVLVMDCLEDKYHDI